jgi:hypothetical protein
MIVNLSCSKKKKRLPISQQWQQIQTREIKQYGAPKHYNYERRDKPNVK